MTAFDKVEAGLAVLREKYLGKMYDVTTSDGMKEAKQARKDVAHYRIELEKVRKAEKADILARGKLIDGEAKRITEELRKIEDPIADQIKVEEDRIEAERQRRIKEERDRIERALKQIERVSENVFKLVGSSSESIRDEAERIKSLVLPDGEFLERSNAARSETLEKLRSMFLAAEKRESEERSLAVERAKIQEERGWLERERKEHEASAAEARLEVETEKAAVEEMRQKLESAHIEPEPIVAGKPMSDEMIEARRLSGAIEDLEKFVMMYYDCDGLEAIIPIIRDFVSSYRGKHS